MSSTAPTTAPSGTAGEARRSAAGGGARITVPLGWILPVGLALVWELAVRSGWSNGRLMPPPSRIAGTLCTLAASGELYDHVVATSVRVAWGFAAGAAVGILAGALTGAVPLARRLLDPTIQALRAIPSIAWVPLFILWFGIFETSKIVLIAAGVFFPVYLGVASAVLSVDRRIVEVGRAFRLSRPALVRRVLLPAILPQTVTALRTGLGLGWMFVVAAEFMGASEGLGYLLVDGQQLGKADQIVAAILVFAALGKVSDACLAAASEPFLRWQDRHQDGI
ncbi:ABC transporter permease [Aureimonas sp. ME7]|uniref:ABC transporter permease n=1 Tax=Aureimonas sp. ME7 TaxID=2744252 RepID=UPI0015F7483D|nr:ABC transporter permease [Aureimonas sp. ME7]